MKIVFDTNVLVSALITTGRAKELFLKAVEGQIQLVLSEGILNEFKEVARDPRISKYVDREDVAVFLEILRRKAKIVRVKSKLRIVKEDLADDVILRTAIDGKTDWIVSGDRHVLSVGSFRGIKIVTVNEMLALLEKESH
jgi:uncharacterized protein